MVLTTAQQQAIAQPGNVLVMAGAGTGKTRTLVERILNCLLHSNSVSIEQLLVVTFTEAAATEIRQRIRLRLEEEQNRNPNDPRWHEQLALFETAHIGTLHSFCLQLIRPHFYELELDPQLAVLPEDEAQLLAEDTLNTVFEKYYEDTKGSAQDLQQLIEFQGKGSDQGVRALVLKLHHYTQTLASPSGWFEEQLASFKSSRPVQWFAWLESAFADWRSEALSLLKTVTGAQVTKKCADLLLALPRIPTRPEMATALDQIVKECKACPRNKRPHVLKAFEADAEFFLSLVQSGGDIDPLEQDWNWICQSMITLLRLAGDFAAAFAENKRQLGVVDFHDLEQHALRLLWDEVSEQPTAIAKQWRQKLRFIFVDEYQDINAAQDRIIQALSGQEAAGNRFLVGDVKQSIYRFRQAAPHIFQSYAESWRDKMGSSIPLRDNFRSCEGILNFVNQLFALVMKKELGGVSYDEKAQLRFGLAEQNTFVKTAAISHPPVEFHIRVRKKNSDADSGMQGDEVFDELIDLEEVAKEARLVALRCRELKARGHNVWDQELQQFRAVNWCDIAILLRSPSAKAECYAKEFARLGVPLQVQRSGFYDSLEICDLINLLQILDNPLQDIPLLGVLHSPLAGLTANELAIIRLAAKGPFWTALIHWHESRSAAAMRQEKPPPGGDRFKEDAILLKLSTFLERYNRWRRLARQSSLSRCLEMALDETQYDTFLLTQSRGEQRHAHVQRLLRLAQQFDHFQRQGLFRFLRFVEAQKRAQTEPEVKIVSVENSVRLMSIHQSKGLEFPVVVIADLSKPFNLIDLQGSIILDERYGVCPQVKPPHTGKRYPSLPYWLARRRQRREILGEELRLLYVAMTRARDTLILFASVSENTLQELGQGASHLNNLQDAKSLCDWVGYWFARHYTEAGVANTLEALIPSKQESETKVKASSNEHTVHIRSALSGSGRTDLLSWTVHEEKELIESGAELANDLQSKDPEETSEFWIGLQKRLSWKYPFIDATRTSAKASVTALRHQASAVLGEEVFEFQSQTRSNRQWEQKDQAILSSPAPAESSLASATEIGSAHHRFLQTMSLEAEMTDAGLAREARKLCQEQILTEREYALLDFKAIALFWTSDLGRRTRAHATELHRELQFTTRFPAKILAQITGESSYDSLSDEFIVVQGVADLVVLNAREIWLIDFKTDDVKLGAVASRAKLYEPQMKLYARSLAQIYHRPVTRCWLYFIACGKAVEING